MNQEKEPRIGDVFLMYFCGNESEQSGWRPGLVFQNNIGNKYSPNIIAIPMTSNTKRSEQPTHVLLKASETGLRLDSVVLCENPERMSKSKLGFYITTLSDKQMADITVANILSSCSIAYLSQEEVLSAWRRAISLNEKTVEEKV